MAQLVLVVGIGRSGTSVFTAVLSQLGFTVPQPEVEPDDTNPWGFGEPRWAVEFNQELLTSLRVSNFDGRPKAWELTAALADDPSVVDRLTAWLGAQLAVADRVVVKDPRTVWLLPLWERAAARVAADVAYVSMLRPPAEVVASARRWYGDGRHESSRVGGWVNVMLETERLTRAHPRCYVRYDALLADWRAALARVDAALGLGLDLSDGAAAKVDPLVDPTLRRERVTWADLDVPVSLRTVADRAWEALAALTDSAPDPAELDGVRAAYQALYRDAERIAAWSIAAAKRKQGKARKAT